MKMVTIFAVLFGNTIIRKSGNKLNLCVCVIPEIVYTRRYPPTAPVMNKTVNIILIKMQKCKF